MEVEKILKYQVGYWEMAWLSQQALLVGPHKAEVVCHLCPLIVSFDHCNQLKYVRLSALCVKKVSCGLGRRRAFHVFLSLQDSDCRMSINKN